jgi:uncharacterized DUF497 family protein
MTPRFDSIWVSLVAREHMLSKHDVTPEEAIEAVESTRHFQRATDGPGGERRYLVAGKTADSRRLWVILADEGHGDGRIVTAREALGRREKSDHRRAKGD